MKEGEIEEDIYKLGRQLIVNVIGMPLLSIDRTDSIQDRTKIRIKRIMCVVP